MVIRPPENTQKSQNAPGAKVVSVTTVGLGDFCPHEPQKMTNFFNTPLFPSPNVAYATPRQSNTYEPTHIHTACLPTSYG